MLLVVRLLDLAPARRLVDRPAHRVGDGVGVEEDAAVEVARRPAGRLDERGLAAEETLLVGVEDRHDGDLRDVEPLAEEVDADQAVEYAEAKVRRMATRSSVSMSEWRYRQRTPSSEKYA